MPDAYPSVSVRLSPDLMKTLDKVARRRKRTRSAIVKEILQNHFAEETARVGRLDRLIAMAGAGAEFSTFKSGDEVDAWIRQVRGDD